MGCGNAGHVDRIKQVDQRFVVRSLIFDALVAQDDTNTHWIFWGAAHASDYAGLHLR